MARGPGGKEQLATRLLDQAQATLLPGTENAADPFFSPDGQWIGFFADRKMKKISVQGGAALTLCDAPSARGASWGEDGSIIVTLTPGSAGLSRVPAAGGTPQAITKPGDKGEVTHRWPQILPGGQAVLFMGNTVNGTYDNASIEVLSLKTGQWKVVQRGGYFGRYLPSGHLVYIHQGTLFAVPFDLDRLETRGTPAPVLEGVAANAQEGGGQYDVARNGTLVYLSGKSSTAGWPVVWMDSTGKTQPLLAAPAIYYSPRFSPDGGSVAEAWAVFACGGTLWFFTAAGAETWRLRPSEPLAGRTAAGDGGDRRLGPGYLGLRPGTRRGVDKMNRINQFACPRHPLIRTHTVFVGFMQLVILTYTPKRRRIVSQSMMRRVKQIKQDRWLGGGRTGNDNLALCGRAVVQMRVLLLVHHVRADEPHGLVETLRRRIAARWAREGLPPLETGDRRQENLIGLSIAEILPAGAILGILREYSRSSKASSFHRQSSSPHRLSHRR